MGSSGQKIFVIFIVLFFVGSFCGFLGVGGGYTTWAMRSVFHRQELLQEYYAPQQTAWANRSATAQVIATLDATRYPEWEPTAVLADSANWPVVTDSFITAYDELWNLEHRDTKLVRVTPHLVGEQFQISLLGPGLFEVAAFAPRVNPVGKPLSVRVDCQTIDGDGSCGLIFWAATDVWWNSTGQHKFIRLTIRGDEFLIENGYSSLALYPEASRHINPEGMNQLQVIAMEGNLFFFINGNLVETYASRLRSGRVGIYVHSPADIERGTFAFENFEIRVP